MADSTKPAHSLSGAKGISRPLRDGDSKDNYYKPFPANYFAPKPGNQALDIGIVGAGIAGLTAAVALVQSGHNVEACQQQGRLQP